MARRGQCRCGCAVSAQRGPNGYKTRCSGCRAVVRLSAPPVKKRRSAATLRKTTCSCGAIVVVDAWPLACPCCDRQLLVPRAFPEPPQPRPQGDDEPPRVLDLFEESRPAPDPCDTPREPPLEYSPVERVCTAGAAPFEAAVRWLRGK